MHTKLACAVSTLLIVGSLNVHASTQAARVLKLDCISKAYQVVRDGKSIK